MKKIIELPGGVLDYVEGLWYKAQGYKQLVRHLSCQPEKDCGAIREFAERYAALFTEYNMALSHILSEYAKSEVSDGYCVLPNYGICALVATRKGDACA